jgi:hypothetical protein
VQRQNLELNQTQAVISDGATVTLAGHEAVQRRTGKIYSKLCWVLGFLFNFRGDRSFPGQTYRLYWYTGCLQGIVYQH